MLSQFSYPIICADNFALSVAFYEDYFNYVPAFEMDGFVVLQRLDHPEMYLAIIDSKNEVIPEAYQRPTSGMILNYPVLSVKTTYQDLYLEGLNIITEPSNALCGRRHFFVEDPNGILIDVAENIPLDRVFPKDQLEKISVMIN